MFQLKCRLQGAGCAVRSACTSRRTVRPKAALNSLQDGSLKVIGLGSRGVCAVDRLIGESTFHDAQFWSVDSDRKVLASTSAPHTLLVQQENEGQFEQEQLQQLVRSVADVPAIAGNDGGPTNGVVFVLGAAINSAGGATMVLQLVSFLRRHGFFVVAAMTRPFEFEGLRKVEQADALIEALEDVAHLVAVVRSDTLLKSSADLTMDAARSIAETTLEFMVRSILWALQAPEMLKVSRGSFQWHGRDLRQYQRLLTPPLQHLLTCPGFASLGRGQAVVPLATLQQAGLSSTLTTLAEDAVDAALESPFLEDCADCATAVLCVLSVPAYVQYQPSTDDSSPNSAGSHSLKEVDKHALRSALQVAAMTISELASTRCSDIVVCPYMREDWSPPADGSLVVEATLLVLADPNLKEARTGHYTSSSAASVDRLLAAANNLHAKTQRAAAQTAMSATTAAAAAPGSKTQWRSAMSALAGGSSTTAQGLNKAPRNSGSVGNNSVPLPAQAPTRLVAPTPLPRQRTPPLLDAQPLSRRTPPKNPEVIPRIADGLADSLVAQSLDLPPVAARWRHQQRAALPSARPAKISYQLPLVDEGADEEGEGEAGSASFRDIRSRVAGMLEKERAQPSQEL